MKYRFLVSMLLVFAVPSFAADRLVLITEKEASMPAGDVPKSRGITRGPSIEQISPDPGARAVKGPIDFKVKFSPHGGAAILPETVQIQYIKTPIIDLTERAAPFINDKGVSVAGAVVPAGEHKVQISVQDSNGRWGTAVMSINVTK